MASSAIDLSLVIVTWNSETWIQRCLASIYAETSDLRVEVIIIDNASQDRTVQMVMNQFGQAAIVPNESNRGFAAAVNQGLEVAQGRYVCLLNPDTVVTDRALERMVETMDREPNIGIIAPHLLNEDGTTQASVRRFPMGQDQGLILTKLHLLFPDAASLTQYFARNFDYRRSQDVEQPMGACLLIRRDVFSQIGILDEHFYLWFEEVDFCRRLRERTDYRIFYDATSHIIHYGGDSFDKVSLSQKQRWYRRSVRYYFRKHKQWGAYALICVLTPLSVLVGMATDVYSKTKGGKAKMQEARDRRKQS